jgi:hypothetical protein
MKRYLFAVVGALLMASPAFAAGYGDAGCGLGSLIFGDQKGPVQILAATTNGTFYSQAFGISTGTSNCDAQDWVLNEQDQKAYAEANFSSLTKAMATGEGEQLTAFATVLGCPTAVAPEFARYTQTNYEVIFASDATTSVEMLRAVKAGIAADPVLSASCSR